MNQPAESRCHDLVIFEDQCVALSSHFFPVGCLLDTHFTHSSFTYMYLANKTTENNKTKRSIGHIAHLRTSSTQ